MIKVPFYLNVERRRGRRTLIFDTKIDNDRVPYIVINSNRAVLELSTKLEDYLTDLKLARKESKNDRHFFRVYNKDMSEIVEKLSYEIIYLRGRPDERIKITSQAGIIENSMPSFAKVTKHPKPPRVIVPGRRIKSKAAPAQSFSDIV